MTYLEVVAYFLAVLALERERLLLTHSVDTRKCLEDIRKRGHTAHKLGRYTERQIFNK